MNFIKKIIDDVKIFNLKKNYDNLFLFFISKF